MLHDLSKLIHTRIALRIQCNLLCTGIFQVKFFKPVNDISALIFLYIFIALIRLCHSMKHHLIFIYCLCLIKAFYSNFVFSHRKYYREIRHWFWLLFHTSKHSIDIYFKLFKIRQYCNCILFLMTIYKSAAS